MARLTNTLKLHKRLFPLFRHKKAPAAPSRPLSGRFLAWRNVPDTSKHLSFTIRDIPNCFASISRPSVRSTLPAAPAPGSPFSRLLDPLIQRKQLLRIIELPDDHLHHPHRPYYTRKRPSFEHSGKAASLSTPSACVERGRSNLSRGGVYCPQPLLEPKSPILFIYADSSGRLASASLPSIFQPPHLNPHFLSTSFSILISPTIPFPPPPYLSSFTQYHFPPPVPLSP